MKKLIFLLTCFGLVFGFHAAAQAATITVGEAMGKPGTEVSVPVTIDDTADRLDCSFAVSFDTAKLEYTGKTSGNMGATVLTATLAEINTAGKVQPIVQFEEDGATSGTIVNFKFKIKETAPIDTILPLIISDLVPAETYSGVSGKIIIVETLCTVTISPSSATVFEGASQTFSASTSGQGCITGVYTWSVSSTIGSTITQNGLYTAGSTDAEVTDTITATDTANGNVTAQAMVTVKPIFCMVTVSPSSATVKEGESKVFSASTTGENCSRGVYTWSVSSTIGSTITQNGLYRAGSTDAQVTDTVIATDTANDNITGQATVTVTPIPIPPAPPQLVSPENGYTSAPPRPTFTWEPSEGAVSYELKVSTDPQFTAGSLVIDQSGIKETSFTPTIPLTSEPYAPFFWQVTAVNDGGTASSEVFTFILKVTGAQELTSEERLKDGTDISAYQMISVPLDLEDPDPRAVLGDGFQNCDQTKWRFFRYDSNIEDYHEYDCVTDDPYLDFEPGRAFWLITTNKDKHLNVVGIAVPTESYFSVFLQLGFNQIGDPFGFPVDWLTGYTKITVVAENGQEFLIDQQPRLPLIEYDSLTNFWGLWEWNGTGYDQPGIMKPWAGYWVNVLRTPESGLLELRIYPYTSISSEDTSYIPTSYIPSPPLPPTEDFAQESVEQTTFAIKLSVQGKKTRDMYNYIGIVDDSSKEYDRHDISEPPRLSTKQVSLYFPHEDWKNSPGIYATDFRPLSAIDEPFFFIISGGEKDEKVTLTWSGVNEVPEGYKTILFDVKKGKSVDMRKTNSFTYKVDKKKEREFQILITKNASPTLVDDLSTNFLEDELDGDSMEDLDLY
jgi:hypothetical protein